MAKKTNKWFDNGASSFTRYADSDTLLFYRHGSADGFACFVPHVRRYVRNGTEFPSLAALLRSVAAEHVEA